MPAATENYNLEDYDVVITSTSSLAKGVITQPNTLHICYCHTPTRYLWSQTHSYVKGLNYNKLIKIFLPLILNKLRLWDKLAAERVDYFIANSETTRKRIKKYYNRDAEIINPPVDTHKFYISPNIKNYFLTGGRLVQHKRFDLAVIAFSKMNVQLKVFGIGPEFRNLRKYPGVEKIRLGDILDISIFNENEWVDITGTSKGKGFQGVIRRHGFTGVGGATHGQHNRMRAPGSVGASSFPSRVLRGMRMAGQTGNKKVKIINLMIARIDIENNLLYLKGPVPGHKGSYIVIEK